MRASSSRWRSCGLVGEATALGPPRAGRECEGEAEQRQRGERAGQRLPDGDGMAAKDGENDIHVRQFTRFAGILRTKEERV